MSRVGFSGASTTRTRGNFGIVNAEDGAVGRLTRGKVGRGRFEGLYCIGPREIGDALAVG